jgi:hypothetical protein
MILFLILSTIFLAGFIAGYAARSWRPQQRRWRWLASQREESKSRASMFGHARRAF